MKKTPKTDLANIGLYVVYLMAWAVLYWGCLFLIKIVDVKFVIIIAFICGSGLRDLYTYLFPKK